MVTMAAATVTLGRLLTTEVAGETNDRREVLC